MPDHQEHTARQNNSAARTVSKRATTAVALLVVCMGAAAEPFAEFDALVKRCRDAFELRPITEVAYAEPARSWVKRMFAPADVSYRVRKTSSAVSPFVGQIEITEIASAQRGSDEDTVRAMYVSMEENLMRSVRRINFAFQDNAWTVIGGTSVVEVKRDAGERFSAAGSARHSREALLDSKGPMEMCVGARSY